MADKNIFKLEGKSQEQVKEAFLEFLKIDKTKPGGYASVGSNKVICKVAKEACGVNSVLEIKKAEDATEVSKLLTGRIDEELDYGKRHQMTSLRCHVRKYIEFLNFCEGQKGKPVYEFDKDPDKPFIGASQFKKIVSLLKAKKNIILEGAPGVGKTFLARKIAYQLIGFVKDENIEMVQFRFLLDIPDKVAVVVHRRYSEEDLRRLREEWLACGERGGVLVSAAISTKEKEVLREAMNRGYRIVLLRENGFPRLYKPCGESFYACSEGLLLQISPWDYHMEKKTITREQCLELNEMAERIAEWR